MFWWNKLSMKGLKSLRFHKKNICFTSKVNKSEPLNKVNNAYMEKGAEVKKCGKKYPPYVNLQRIDSLM